MSRRTGDRGISCVLLCIVACAALTGTESARDPKRQQQDSLLPAGSGRRLEQVLNSQSQAGSSGRHLNISMTGAASPAASADGNPTITGTIADTSVDTGPRSVDVQVTVDPVINIHGDILNVSSDQQPTARFLSTEPQANDSAMTSPPAQPPLSAGVAATAPPPVQAGAEAQPALLLLPGTADAGAAGKGVVQQQRPGIQMDFLPSKPPALPANSTVPLQVAGALLAAALSIPPPSQNQQTTAVPAAAMPQLPVAAASGTPSSVALTDPQVQPASANRASGHYPFNWAVVIAAVSSTATFMLLIVLLLAFASGFLPHRRRRAAPGSPPPKTPPSPQQSPNAATPSNKSITEPTQQSPRQLPRSSSADEPPAATKNSEDSDRSHARTGRRSDDGVGDWWGPGPRPPPMRTPFANSVLPAFSRPQLSSGFSDARSTSGGGMLGIAHVGFTYVLEKAGIRFRGIAGTSAGAINAALIAGLRPNPAGESGTETLKHLAAAPFSKFMDGDADVKELQNVVLQRVGGSPAPKVDDEKPAGGLRALLQKINPLRYFRWVGLLGDARFIGPALKIVRDRGMYPGVFFEDWMKSLMDIRAPTVEKLYKCLELPPLQLTDSRLTASKASGRAAKDAELLKYTKGDLAIIASDITTETKAVFPDHTELYYENPGQVSPSEFVRMSMSIPVFFQPKEVGVPLSVIESGVWKKTPGVTYDGTFPPPETKGPFQGKVRITFVDGGTLSNFPIGHFHTRGVPLLPTFGVRLSTDRNNYSDTSSLIQMHILDREFLFDNPDYQKLVSTIDTAGFNWLNFDMKQDEQIRLFQRGAEAAASFLLGPPLDPKDVQGLKGRDASKGFDWEAYKEIREALSSPLPAAP
ncbi:hypothetical protein COCSUDRAFT_39310 [Coccomyxa subellipsoidea C-169]|uniref:Patatin n=1 Tax=Coccomyxa subellipsoidea (strain C-169) TaxID=574566 RepID=I0ZAQ4_COCSC|nr:hypothetical protein COCSUDRAFT_39310 [Coccomyxa subellipsoidea C-169]EIE27723.1 hypothetical protein COCSUDRAFT_39310 [Coccomyxa subellipsoidea C-169]|eukprot:XP_005652267.1 hypothetical protein COCSUDRAFT_39310 [Coccomyxa subellipsoidea C-169]